MKKTILFIILVSIASICLIFCFRFTLPYGVVLTFKGKVHASPAGRKLMHDYEFLISSIDGCPLLPPRSMPVVDSLDLILKDGEVRGFVGYVTGGYQGEPQGVHLYTTPSAVPNFHWQDGFVILKEAD